MVATGQVSNMQESHTVTVMEGIKWQQRDSYSAIICPAECKLFSNNQEARSKRESAVITIACCCFKRIHIHTGHTASTSHILYLSLVSLSQDFVFAHFHLPSHDLTTQLYGLRLSCSVQYLMGLNDTFGQLVDNYSKTRRLFINHQFKKTLILSFLFMSFLLFNALSSSGWSLYAVLAPSFVAAPAFWISFSRRRSSSWRVATTPSLECGTFGSILGVSALYVCQAGLKFTALNTMIYTILLAQWSICSIHHHYFEQIRQLQRVSANVLVFWGGGCWGKIHLLTTQFFFCLGHFFFFC